MVRHEMRLASEKTRWVPFPMLRCWGLTVDIARNREFESCSLQRRVMGELGPGSTSALREKALRSRSCAAWLRSSSGEVPRRTRSIWQPMSGRNRRRRAAAAPKATTSPIRRAVGAGTPRRFSRTAPPSMLYAPLDDADGSASGGTRTATFGSGSVST
jgi:hypothetical protein